MRPEPINRKTRHVLKKIAASEDYLFKKFYLAGGTALAIQLRHRESIDLDWFTEKKFSTAVLKNKLADLGKFELVNEERGTVEGLIDRVKISFFNYPYKQIFPSVDFRGIKIADKRDIAAMKIDAISSRGSKKDFIDFYFLLKEYSLKELVGFFEKKYSNIKYNKLHILKSIVYFSEAENDPMPKMIKPARWQEVKRVIKNETVKYFKESDVKSLVKL